MPLGVAGPIQDVYGRERGLTVNYRKHGRKLRKLKRDGIRSLQLQTYETGDLRRDSRSRRI